MSAMDPDSPALRFVPLAELAVPKDGRVVVDGYWSVHPERGAIFVRDSPQYNKDPRIPAMLREKLYPWAEIRFVPLAFMADHDRRQY